MKAVIALALAGSALAGDYGYGAPVSKPADPVVPSKPAYDGDYKPSSPAAPVVPSKGGYGDYDPKPSSPAAPVVPSKGGYGDYDPKPSSSTPAAPVVPSKGGYGGDWPKSSSTPAGPVTPSKGGYGDYPKSSSAAAKPTYSKKPYGGDDEEDCDEENGEWDDSTYSKKASSSAPAKPTWSKKPYGDGEWDDSSTTKTWDEVVDNKYTMTTTLTDSWGKAYPTVLTTTIKSTKTNVITLTRSKSASMTEPVKAWATPDYFNTLACCKTIVTVTEYVKDYKPTPEAVPSYGPPKGDYDHEYHDYGAKPSSSTPAAPELPSKPAYTPKPDYTPKPEGDDSGYWPKPSSSVPAAPAVPSKPAYSGNGPIVNNGDKWGMTYTPYTKDGQCKTADQVDADIAKIKSFGFTTVRLYATDCDGLKNVGASTKKYEMKIIVGVFIDKKGLQASWDQVDEIAAWGKTGGWDNVVMVVVGNEAIFNGYCSGPELADYVTKVKSYLAENGYTGWCTTTEPVYIIEQNKDCLCGVMDVAAANVQPFFTSSISASTAGDFVLSQLAQVEAACPGKDAYNLECGWPSAGSSNGAAVPSKADQKAAIYDIIAKAGKKTVVFSYEDDEWKDGGEFGVEKSWGCGDLF